MEHWELEMIKSKKEQELKKKYPDIGKIVKYKGEYGLVVFDSTFEDDGEPFDKDKFYIDAYAIRWDSKREFDLEEYFFDYEFIDSYEFNYINMDGNLKDKYKKKK
jgi:hypothetical protein